LIPVISFVGRHNSGKTSVLEKVVQVLSEGGFRVGIIKHSSEQFDIDVPEKDTFRLAKAGAKALTISSASRFAYYRDVEREMSLTELVALLGDELDIIITEGYKREDRPKIEVARREISTELIKPSNLTALVTDFPVDKEIGVPVFGFHEIEEISRFIVDNFLQNHVR